jgi:hypothetical protein
MLLNPEELQEAAGQESSMLVVLRAESFFVDNVENSASEKV